jgi:hypothetical protein
MKDEATRFRVVGGTDVEESRLEANQSPAKAAPKKRAKRPPMKDQMIPFKCGPCSEELGGTQHTLVQLMTQPFEVNGKIIAGGLWWACSRCMKPYYQIRTFVRRTDK